MRKRIALTASVLILVIGLADWALASGITQTAYNLIENAGSALTMRSTLNFTGAGVSCADNSGSVRTDCTISGSAGNPTITVANASSTGTTTATLTKLTGAPSTALIAATTDTGGVVGITTSGAGTTGNATITIAGTVNCVFDGATTAGDYVRISSSTAGNCHDAGATYPTSGQVLGRVLSTNVGGGTYSLDLFPSEIEGAAGASTNSKIRSIGAGFDGGGSAITSSTVTYFTVPFGCTIAAWNITVDTGTITFDVWKIASGTAIPTVANSITASALPAISSGTAVHSTTLTGWTTSVTANDIFGIDVNAVASTTRASLVLECDVP